MDAVFVSSGVLVRDDSSLLCPHHPVSVPLEVLLIHNRTAQSERIRIRSTSGPELEHASSSSLVLLVSLRP